MSGIPPNVPAEIIRMIFENLAEEPSCLYQLSLTSRILSKIQQKPELGPLVRKYHMPITPRPQQFRKRPFWPLLSQCLPLMTGLKVLAYHHNWKEMKLGLPKLKEGEAFPFQLERFILKGISSTGHETELIQFLETQHNLREFQCISFILPRLIPAGSLPNLKVVEGDLWTIGTLIRTRRTVTEVYWWEWSRYDIEGRDDPEQASFLQDTVFPKLRGLSTYELWSLFGPGRGPRMQNFLRLIAQELQVLELSFVINPSTLNQALDILALFPKLKRFCLWPEAQVNPSDLPALLSAFDKCNNLICLDLWLSGNSYHRWVSRDGPPKRVTVQEEDRLRLPNSL